MSHRLVARSSLGGAGHGVPGFAALAGRGSGSHRGPSVNRARGSGDPVPGSVTPVAVKSGLAIGHAPVQEAPWHHRPAKRARSQDAFPTMADSDALRRRSLLVSKSITSFARYPKRRPAGVVPAGAAWMSTSCGYVGDADTGFHALSCCSTLLTMPSRTTVGVVSYCTATMTGALG